MSDGFLGRWSRRKLEVKQGKPAESEALEAQPEPSAVIEPGSETDVSAGSSSAVAPSPVAAEGDSKVPVEVPPPTLEDVKALTAGSDFSRFAAADVAPEVKNAAMKKLFADPRYNVMDGLDVYTGDYSRPDPIPQAMLRQLAGARFLGLFDEEERQEEAARQAGQLQARDVADNPTAQTVAKSSAVPSEAVPEPPEHADPDLRLQQDDAAAGEDPGRGAG